MCDAPAYGLARILPPACACSTLADVPACNGIRPTQVLVGAAWAAGTEIAAAMFVPMLLISAMLVFHHMQLACRYFVGAAWAAGMEIASGMFVPMLLIGAVLGRLMGLVMVDQFGTEETAAWWMPAADAQWKWIDPGVFAVVGAAGFMGGVTRLTIALAAIMMEVRLSTEPRI